MKNLFQHGGDMKKDGLYSEEIIRYLGSCKRYPDSESAQMHAKIVRVIERWSGIAAFTILVLLAILAVAHHYYPLPSWLLLYVQLLGLLGLLCMVINVLTWPVVKLARCRSWNADAADYDARSEAHVRSIAMPLVRCDPEQLKFVDSRLAERFDGINNRMSIVFGENVFKVGVVALIFSAMDNLGKLPEQIHKFGLTVSPTLLIGLAVYLVLFFMVTPVSLKVFASRYPFQRRVIKVALELQELQRSGGMSKFKPPGLDLDDEKSELDGG